MASGYSGTPLVKKLGIREGSRVAVVGAPEGFTGLLEGLPPDTSVTKGLRGSRGFDVVIAFTRKAAELTHLIDRGRARMEESGGLWIAWPKKASGVVTDVTEDIVRAAALDAGLVDNKVCAIDETWSGLRLVIRLKDRAKR